MDTAHVHSSAIEHAWYDALFLLMSNLRAGTSGPHKQRSLLQRSIIGCLSRRYLIHYTHSFTRPPR